MKRKKTVLILGTEIITFFLFVIFLNSKYIEKIPACWIYQTTTWLCPACGGTRCVINLFKGNWAEAFFSHNLFFMGIVYLLVINVVYLINLEKEKKIATWVYPKYWYAIIFAILLIPYTILRNLL